MLRNFIFIMILLCAGGLPACAEPVYTAHVRAELVTDVSSIAPGEPFWVGLHMVMDEGWHTYWRNSGDSGMPTSIQWELPEGFKAGGIHWPLPKRFDYNDGLTGYGYDGETVLLTEMSVPAALEAGSTVTVKAKVKWLSCAEICVPGKAEFSLALSVAEDGPVVRDDIRSLFDAQRKTLLVMKSDWRIEAAGKGDMFIFRLSSAGEQRNIIKTAAFFPYRNDIIDHAAQQEFTDNDSGPAELAVKRSSLSDELVQDIRGVMVLEEITPAGKKREGIYVDVPVLE